MSVFHRLGLYSGELYHQLIYYRMQTDNGIETLLDLNGNIVQQERGLG